MWDLIYTVLAFAVAGLSILGGCMLLIAPIAILMWIARGGVSPKPRSVKDEVVAAQWEYDRTLRRRDK